MRVLYRVGPLLFLFLCCFFRCCRSLPAYASTDDHGLELREVRQGSVISLEYVMHDVSEATVTITAVMDNMASSVPLPLTVELSRKYGTLVTFTLQDPNRPWRWYWHYDWKIGQRLRKKPKPYQYSLPFRGTFPIVQGPHGTFSHGPGSQNEEATDFGMPVGTPVQAARAGVVIAIRADCVGGGLDPKWERRSNYVVIKHSDGTYAEYQHLRHDGVLVRLGDHVREGQEIAFSGDTGYAAGPHLHFAVFDTLSGSMRETLPVTFRKPH